MKYKASGPDSSTKYDGELENLLKLTEDEELQQLLGINGGNASPDNIQALRVMWRKEKNRIAAKKSREKKANLMMELEKKEMHLSSEVETLKRFVLEYENIIEALLRYIKCTLDIEWPMAIENIQNKLSRQKDLKEHEKDVYRKLIHCLEYFYHIRNSENYVVPYKNGMVPNRHDASNRLIDEILYSIKNTSGFPDKNKM